VSAPAKETPASQPQRSYARHRPETTLLFEIVRDHLDAFLDMARERSSRPLPAYVVREFRDYLRCGLLEYGFARLHCDACQRDVLVAFSCKGRGLCPSCGARRMNDTAARLADHVFPAIPVRQWVLSVPYEVRLVLARDAAALSAASRIFFEEVSRAYRAGRTGRDVATGAVTFVQRFGSMNLNVHLHVVFADGVFVRDAAVRFVAATRPGPKMLETVAQRTARRLTRWLRRRGLRVEGATDDQPEARAACEALAMQPGRFATVAEREGLVSLDEERDHRRFARKKLDPDTANVDGFDIHAGVFVPAEDRHARERLFRYGARPAVSLSRMSRLPDGRLAYRLKHPGPYGHTHRVMTPVEFLARVAALIPPP
jgi:hypothetical protein